MTSESSKQEILDQVEQTAGDYMESGKGSCAQGAFFALQQEFNLKEGMVLKALEAMPGIAFRGDTCGAVLGALATLGVSPSRDKLNELESFRSLARQANALCDAFEKEFGSLMCSRVHPELLGKNMNWADILLDPEPKRLQELFQTSALMAKKCRIPTGKAARFAAEILLEEKSRT